MVQSMVYFPIETFVPSCRESISWK